MDHGEHPPEFTAHTLNEYLLSSVNDCTLIPILVLVNVLANVKSCCWCSIYKNGKIENYDVSVYTRHENYDEIMND